MELKQKKLQTKINQRYHRGHKVKYTTTTLSSVSEFNTLNAGFHILLKNAKDYYMDTSKEDIINKLNDIFDKFGMYGINNDFLDVAEMCFSKKIFNTIKDVTKGKTSLLDLSNDVFPQVAVALIQVTGLNKEEDSLHAINGAKELQQEILAKMSEYYSMVQHFEDKDSFLNPLIEAVGKKPEESINERPEDSTKRIYRC
jgi:hypothetical protein